MIWLLLIIGFGLYMYYSKSGGIVQGATTVDKLQPSQIIYDKVDAVVSQPAVQKPTGATAYPIIGDNFVYGPESSNVVQSAPVQGADSKYLANRNLPFKKGFIDKLL